MKKVILAAIVGLSFASTASAVDFDFSVDHETGLPSFGQGEAYEPNVDSGFGQGHLPNFGQGEAQDPNGEDDFFGQIHKPSNPGAGGAGAETPTLPTEPDSQRPYPGQGERPQPGTGIETPTLPEFDDTGSVDRPMPPAFIGQIGQNKDNIAAMGQAFEQRVDAVNGYLSQAGSAIQNNSNKIDALGAAFQAQAAHTASEITRLDGRIDSLEKKTDKLKAGVAGATAIASLTQYVGNGTHHVAVGIGGYDGASALAGGYTYAISANTTIRATVALDSEDEIAFGASVGHSW